MRRAEEQIPQFLPVRVVSAPTTLPMARPATVVSAIPSKAPAVLEVVLPNGYAVRVAEGFNAETLAGVLEVAAGIRP